MGEPRVERPAGWTEQEAPQAFVGKLAASPADALPMLLFAAVCFAAPVAWFSSALSSAVGSNGVALLVPLLPGLVGLALAYHGLCLLVNRPTFALSDGSFTFSRGVIPQLGSMSIPLADIVAFRAAERTVRGSRGEFTLWDLVVEVRGHAHRAKLSLVSAAEAAWIAERLTAAKAARLTAA